MVLHCVVVTTEMKLKALKEEAEQKKLKRQKAQAAAAAAAASAASAVSPPPPPAVVAVDKKPDLTPTGEVIRGGTERMEEDDDDHRAAVARKNESGRAKIEGAGEGKRRSSSLDEPPLAQPPIPFKKEIFDNDAAPGPATGEAPIGGPLAPVIKKEIVDNSSSNSNPPPDLDQDGGESEQRSSSSPSSASFPALSRPPDAPLLPIVPATTSTRAVADSTCP